MDVLSIGHGRCLDLVKYSFRTRQLYASRVGAEAKKQNGCRRNVQSHADIVGTMNIAICPNVCPDAESRVKDENETNELGQAGQRVDDHTVAAHTPRPVRSTAAASARMCITPENARSKASSKKDTDLSDDSLNSISPSTHCRTTGSRHRLRKPRGCSCGWDPVLLSSTMYLLAFSVRTPCLPGCWQAFPTCVPSLPVFPAAIRKAAVMLV